MNDDWVIENLRVTLFNPKYRERVTIQNTRAHLHVTSQTCPVPAEESPAAPTPGRGAVQKAETGELPDTGDEFAAYDPIALRERPRDAEPDKAVIKRLMKRIGDRIGQRNEGEKTVLAVFGLPYVEARAEAILLRQDGWDVVPLMLDRPALALVSYGSVVALRDSYGAVAIHPDRRGTLNHFFFALHKTEDMMLRQHEVLGIDIDTRARLAGFAEALWRRARENQNFHRGDVP